MGLDRRSVLKSAAGLVLAAGGVRSPVRAQAPRGDYPFALGVASGDPWPDGFVIWTRLAPRPLEEHGGMPAAQVPVTWEVAEDARFSKIVRKGQAMAFPELAHSIHVEVGGLAPQRPYWYRFTVAGTDASPAGMARTAPAMGVMPQRLRIAVGGCQHYEMGFFNAWAEVAREPDLDLVFHYGDYIYEGKAGPLGKKPNGLINVRQHVGEEIMSIDDYRRRYAQYKSDPDLQAAHAACAFACSFDDHEVDNNWAADIEERGMAPEVFVLRRAMALQAWYEHMPVRRTQFPTPGGLHAWRRLDYGRLLRMHVLDTRSQRSDQPCNDGKYKSCPPEAHSSPTLLGAMQEAWLDEGLGNDATWNLIAQQLLTMPFDVSKPGAAEPRFATDTWDGYRPARARLVETIRRHGLTNVVIASGDYHRNFVGTLPVHEEAPDGEQAAVEFLATSATSEGLADLPPLDHLMAANPHLALFDDDRGYHLHEITPQSWTGEVKALDQIKARGGKVVRRTRFVVSPGAPALNRG